jgi:hypothetical protein
MGVRQGLRRHGLGLQLLFFILMLLQAHAGRGLASINGEGDNDLLCRESLPCGSMASLRSCLAISVSFDLCLWIPVCVVGLALLELKVRVEADPHGAFQNWDPMDSTPCRWSGVRCLDGKVEIL